MSLRWKVVVVEHRPNPHFIHTSNFARSNSLLSVDNVEFIATQHVEWCNTREEARKLIRRRFNKHNPFTVSASMEPSLESATSADLKSSLVEPNLL